MLKKIINERFDIIMDQVKFNSIDELYNRLKPAFKIKIEELETKNILNIENKDLWMYLSKTKWQNKENLELCDMVSDILNLDEYDFLKYINNKK